MKVVEQHKKFSEEEYFLFEERSEVRHELINGNLYEMSGVSIFHNDIVGNLYLLFRSLLKGTDWRISFEAFKVKTGDGNFFYPDIVVFSGEVERYYTDKPILIVEVLSDTTRKYDLTDKFIQYQKFPSLHYYLCIEPEQQVVIFYYKSENNEWMSEAYTKDEHSISPAKFKYLIYPQGYLSPLMQLVFYTTRITSRVKYIVSTLVTAIGIENYLVTDDTESYLKFEGAKINYTTPPLNSNELHIRPVQLLFEEDIKVQEISCFNWNSIKAFYKTEGNFPFDIFAASFYLLSRYEEYIPHHLDEYGRYGHRNSLAFKENFLHVPLINLWLIEFKKQLLQKFSSLKLKPCTFQFIPTYDIDIAWSYLNKGLIRNAGGTLRSIVKTDWPSLKERWNVLAGKKKDPFDIYEWLNEVHHKCNLRPCYFFLLAKRQKRYDRNISPNKLALQRLIEQTASKDNVGIHPSWQSEDDTSLLQDEINTLSKITGKDVTSSRQHYIRMKLPNTYHNLLAAGITEDFSMGYGSINGFRASYCLPFYWYDLERETTTQLLIYPFCWMEANSYFEQKFSLEQAREELQHYFQVTNDVDGLLITICHNHILGNKQLFRGWKEMYEEFCLSTCRH